MSTIHPMRLFLFAIITTLIFFCFAGCSALGPINRALTSVKSPVVQAGVDLAVATAIGNGADSKAKAAQIKAIATAVYTASNAPSVAIADLEGVLNAEILKVAPNPADRVAFQILASTLEASLTAYVQANAGGAVTAQTLVSIQGVAQAVITACGFYTA